MNHDNFLFENCQVKVKVEVKEKPWNPFIFTLNLYLNLYLE